MLLLPEPFRPALFQVSLMANWPRWSRNQRMLGWGPITGAPTMAQPQWSPPEPKAQSPETLKPPGSGSAFPKAPKEVTMRGSSLRP